MTNGILRFNTNAPVEVALRWDDGKRVEGRYGVSVAAKKGTSLAVETEPGVGLRSGLRWAQE